MSARHQRAKEVPLNIHLHARQFTAFTSLATEILYGGAAGGGKSHLMRVAAIIFCAAIPGLQVYLFRRLYDDLIKNHMEGPKGFRNMLAPWEQVGFVKIVENEIRFWNGSKIYLCHCQHDKDRFKYQGAEIHVLIIDELTHFTEVVYRFLRNRVRAVGLNVPAEYAGRIPRILCGSNPGNIGHGWVKSSFVDNADDLAIRQMSKSEGGMLRQFIRAKLEDNPSMMEDDPTYEDRLEGIGSDALVKAMRWGDWDVIEGAFFDNFDAKRHVIRPVALPESWPRFRAGDWGSAKPFSIGWYRIVDDTWRHPDGIIVPRGCLIKYREWYGVKESPDGTFQADVGLKLTAEEVAKGILEREKGEKIGYGVLDPAAFSEDGGPSIAERMHRYIHPTIKQKVLWRAADNKRVPTHGALGGWDQMRSRLNGDEDERALLLFFSTCRHTIRTIPALQHDENRPEDVMTHSEDHCFAAGTLVETDNGPIPIEQLPPQGLVHSLGGLRPYRSARMTRSNASIVKLTFDNGRVIHCTPDHKFLVGRDEWRYAADLKGRSVLCSQLSSAPRSRNSTAIDIISAASTFSARALGSILSFGDTTMATFRKAIMSITEMKTVQTITATTSNALQCRSIWATGMVPRLLLGGQKHYLPRVRQPLCGTDRKRAEIGTKSTLPSTSLQSWPGALRRFALSAAKNTSFARRNKGMANIATKTAGRVRCVAVDGMNVRANVYCLTVPSTACFAIEGGILVSNCGDETRYACMSRPHVPTQRKADKTTDRWSRAFKRREGGDASKWKTS